LASSPDDQIDNLLTGSQCVSPKLNKKTGNTKPMPGKVFPGRVSQKVKSKVSLQIHSHAHIYQQCEMAVA
jgi:hypothetical protein